MSHFFFCDHYTVQENEIGSKYQDRDIQQSCQWCKSPFKTDCTTTDMVTCCSVIKSTIFFSKFCAIRGLLLLIVTFIRGTNYKKLFMVWNKPV